MKRLYIGLIFFLIGVSIGAYGILKKPHRTKFITKLKQKHKQELTIWPTTGYQWTFKNLEDKTIPVVRVFTLQGVKEYSDIEYVKQDTFIPYGQ